MRRSLGVLIGIFVVALTGLAVAQNPAHTPPKTDEEMIANAMSAVPPAVAKAATIMTIDKKGQMRILRQGSGPFTCMPDNPMTPGNDPMCLDKNGMAWAHAWMTKVAPPAGQIGFGYMLMGGLTPATTTRTPRLRRPASSGSILEPT
jgi:hypothetical protein